MERVLFYATSDKSEVDRLWIPLASFSRAWRSTIAHIYLDEIVLQPGKRFIFFDADEAHIPNFAEHCMNVTLINSSRALWKAKQRFLYQ